MTLLFADGFNDEITQQKWSMSNPALFLTPNGRHGRGLRLMGSNVSASTTFPERETVCLGFAIRKTETAATSSSFQNVQLWTGDSVQITIGPSLDASLLVVRRGNHNGTIIATGPSIPMHVWVYVEAKVTLGTNGSLEVRIDNDTVIDESDINTMNVSADGFDSLRCFSASSLGTMFFDDIYLLDTLGTENNDFLGDVEVRTILPSGAGNRTQMTNADETQVDNFSYVNTPGDEEGFVEGGAGVGDLYEMDNIDAGVIHGVIQYHKSKMSDTGVQKARHLTRYDSVDYEGPDTNLGFSYNAFKRIWEKAPDDTEWTPAKLNATEMGVEGRG